MIHASFASVFVGQLRLSLCAGSEKDGAILEGDVALVVGTFLVAELHGEVHAEGLALLPVLGGADIACLAVFAGPRGFANGDGVFAALGDGEGALRLVGELGLLTDAELLAVEFAGREEVHVERVVGGAMCIDEVTVFRVVLHACADAAPHALVHLRIDAVGEGAQRGEIDVAARLGVLGGHDVVPHRRLVEVGVLRIVRVVEEVFRELQHVVRVARLRTLHIINVQVAVLMALEMLADGVAADADGAVLCHIVPEVQHGVAIVGQRLVLLPSTFEADVLRHLRVGVLTVEEGRVERLHAVDHLAMAILLRSLEIFLVAEDLVGIHQRLVHAAMFRAQHLLHLLVADVAHQVHAPVGEPAEELLAHLAVGIEEGIPQTRQHLMLTIEGHPAARTAELRDVAGIEARPDVVQGLSADESLQTLRVVLVGILTVLHDGEAVVQLLLHLRLRAGIVRGGIGQGEGADVVSAHVSAQVEARIASPVREVGMLLLPSVILRRTVLRQSCLTDEGSHQPVGIVFQQQSVVRFHHGLHRTLEQRHLLEVEMLRIDFALCSSGTRMQGEHRRCHCDR